MSEGPQPKESEAPLPIPADVHARRWWILVVLCTNLVLVVAANAGLNVGIPSIARDLGASQSELQWLVDMFVLVFAGLLMPMGALGDRFGRKRALIIGLGIYAFTSLGALFGHSIASLLAIRAAMGLAAALIMPATLSLITTAFVGRERNLALAIWSGCAGAGAGIGLLTSGSLLLFFDWNAIFLVNVPLALFGMIMGSAMLVESKDPHARPIDALGSTLIVLALWATLIGIIELPVLGFGDPVILGSSLAAVVLWGLFVLRSRMTRTPLVEMDWFRDRRFSVGAFSIALLFFSLMGWFFLSTLFFQHVLGLTPFQSALASLTLSVVQVVFAHRAATWVDLLGTKYAVAMGIGLVTLGQVLAAFFVSPDSPLWPLIVAQVFIGLGLPWASSPATAVVLESLPPSRIGAGSGVNATVREIGAALGIAVMGSIANGIYRARVPIEGLSEEAVALARSGLPEAMRVAEQTPDPQAYQLAAKIAFGQSFQVALLVSAAILVLTTLMVLIIGFDPPTDQ